MKRLILIALLVLVCAVSLAEDKFYASFQMSCLTDSEQNALEIKERFIDACLAVRDTGPDPKYIRWVSRDNASSQRLDLNKRACIGSVAFAKPVAPADLTKAFEAFANACPHPSAFRLKIELSLMSQKPEGVPNPKDLITLPRK